MSLAAHWPTTNLGSSVGPVTQSPPYFVGVCPNAIAADCSQFSTTQGMLSFSSVSTATLTVVVGGPLISVGGVVSGAGIEKTISHNSRISIYGSGLAGNTRPWANADFTAPNGRGMPTSLDGTTVMVNGKPAFVAFISPWQINALSPDDPDTAGSIVVTVTVNHTAGNTVQTLTSGPTSAVVEEVAPSLFTTAGKYLAAQHADYSPVGDAAKIPGATPAKPGETIVIFGTGLGPTNPAIPEGLLLATNSTPVNPVSITIGTAVVTPDFVGLLAGYAGLYRINVMIPNGATGDVPIFATVKGVSSTNTTACCFLTVH